MPPVPQGKNAFRRPKNMRRTFARTFACFKAYRFQLVLVLIGIVLSAGANVAGTYMLKPIINDYIVPWIGSADPDFSGLIGQLAIMFTIYTIGMGGTYLYNRLMISISTGTLLDLRKQLFTHMQKLPIRYFDTRTHGEIMSAYTNDIDAMREMLSQGIPQFISSVINIVGTFLMMVVLSPLLTLIALAMLVVMLLITRAIARRSGRYFKARQDSLSQVNGYIEEMIEGQKVVQVFGHEAESLTAFDEVNGRLQDVSLKAIFFSSLTNPATRFVNNIVYAGVGLVGAVYAVRGGITIGQLSVFLSYANQYTKPFNEISGVVTELQNALACAARVFELLDADDQVPEVENASVLQPDGHVQLEDVSFRYLPDRPLIEGLSLDVKPGQRIAIVGPTGCGKTTLINLLMRFYDVNGGSIKVSGTDIRDVTRASLRSSYGMVLQDTWLRAGTVRENIAYGKPDASLEEIVAAAKAAHADSFIRRLPEGYDTVIAEDGGNISQGQKQLLCIARVMLCLPPMLILDEATSSIDTRTEVRIQKAFARMMQGRTSFIVAHRLSTIREADVILVMKDGHIVEQGSHDELLAANGFYAKLYNSQFEGVET